MVNKNRQIVAAMIEGVVLTKSLRSLATTGQESRAYLVRTHEWITSLSETAMFQQHLPETDLGPTWSKYSNRVMLCRSLAKSIAANVDWPWSDIGLLNEFANAPPFFHEVDGLFSTYDFYSTRQQIRVRQLGSLGALNCPSILVLFPGPGVTVCWLERMILAGRNGLISLALLPGMIGSESKYFARNLSATRFSSRIARIPGNVEQVLHVIEEKQASYDLIYVECCTILGRSSFEWIQCEELMRLWQFLRHGGYIVLEDLDALPREFAECVSTFRPLQLIQPFIDSIAANASMVFSDGDLILRKH